MRKIDFPGGDFKTWLTFLFDHEVESPVWFFADIDYQIDGAKCLNYLKVLFSNPSVLIERYTNEQIDQGLWVICGAQGMLPTALRDPAVPIELCQEVLAAHLNLFRLLFMQDGHSNICKMWWDGIAFSLAYKDPYVPDDDLTVTEREAELREPLFDILCGILKIESRECQLSALHGLGHLQHPKTKEVIENFLRKTPDIDPELWEYAQHSISGEIL